MSSTTTVGAAVVAIRQLSIIRHSTYLTAMHLPTEVPQLHPARPPPGLPGAEGGEEQASENWLN